jgi:hypothetical protein
MELIKAYINAEVGIREATIESRMKIARSILIEAINNYTYYEPITIAKVAYERLLEENLLNHILFVFSNDWNSCKIRYYEEKNQEDVTGAICECHLTGTMDLPVYAKKGI